jgi:predicted histidine transporter YuiF (NhaC family)
MVCGLLVAVFITYRKPREYRLEAILKFEPEFAEGSQRAIWSSLGATVIALILQLATDSIILGSLAGLVIFKLGGVIKPSQSQDLFTRGVKMMGSIGFIMISAAGFAAVMKATGHVDLLVSTIGGLFGDNKALSAFMMLLVGLLITMGIGSSFSTIPVIATIYVPLCLNLEFSAAATIAIVGTSAALGDAGSPASDSTLGPTAGLNTDGQHDHIWDSVVPTFIHYNIPLLLAGWAAATLL